MGGFASLIGGAGQEAAQYGAQMRSLLESRRQDLAGMISKAAEVEPDPQTRASLLQHSADLLSGKPIGKIAQNFATTVQKRHADNEALASVIGQPPSKPKETPGPAAGITPGSGSREPGIPTALNPNAGGESPAPAAQPSANPIQPGSQPIQQLPTSGVPGLPTAQSVQDIYARYSSMPEWSTPAGFQRLKPLMDQEIAHNEALRQTLEQQQATLAYKRSALNNLKASPVWANLPDITKAQYEAEAAGMAAPPMASSLMLPHMISTGTLGEQAPPGTVEFGTNNPVQKGVRYRVMYSPMSGQTMWQPEQAQTGTETTATGGREIVNRQSGDVIAPIQGAVAGSQATPHTLTLPGGATAFQSPAGAKAGITPTPTGGINPAFVPTTTVSQAPGELPTTTTHTKGTGGAAASPHGGGTPSNGSGAGNDLVKREYDDWMAGRVLTPKQQQAARSYATQHNLPSPDQLSAKGQSDLSALDPVIQEIKDLQKRFEQEGLQNADDHRLVPDYAKYAYLGLSTPHNDLFTSLSFEQLRSAAAALKGMNSRAYPIINRALLHTPVLDRGFGVLADTPKTMYDKLRQMETILEEGRSAILSDERKSGVIAPPGGNSAGKSGDPLGIR